MVDRGGKTSKVFGLVIFALLAVLVVCVFQLIRIFGSVNEPDPARFPIPQAERMLHSGGVEARIDRVLHVDLDRYDVIVAGRVRRLDPNWLVREASGGAAYRAGSGRYGEVLIVPIGPGRDLIAVPSASNNAEAEVSAARFRALIPDLLRRQRE